ncbi:MAG: hypothetical protein ACRDKT_12735, partial [Actinomycetota bacterium]
RATIIGIYATRDTPPVTCSAAERAFIGWGVGAQVGPETVSESPKACVFFGSAPDVDAVLDPGVLTSATVYRADVFAERFGESTASLGDAPEIPGDAASVVLVLVKD